MIEAALPPSSASLRTGECSAAAGFWSRRPPPASRSRGFCLGERKGRSLRSRSQRDEGLVAISGEASLHSGRCPSCANTAFPLSRTRRSSLNKPRWVTPTLSQGSRIGKGRPTVLVSSAEGMKSTDVDPSADFFPSVASVDLPAECAETPLVPPQRCHRQAPNNIRAELIDTST